MLSVSSRITAASLTAEFFFNSQFTYHLLENVLRRMFRLIVIKIIKLLVAYSLIKMFLSPVSYGLFFYKALLYYDIWYSQLKVETLPKKGGGGQQGGKEHVSLVLLVS